MALNEERSWPNVHPENANETRKVNVAFLEQQATKVLLKPGFKLYKFNTRGRGLLYNGGASPWWAPMEPLGLYDVGLDGVLKFAAMVGISSTEYARLITAVTEEWNALDIIQKAELKVPVHAFWGQCAKQLKRETKKPLQPGQKENKNPINLTGRGWQLYIPGMTDEHITDKGVISAP